MSTNLFINTKLSRNQDLEEAAQFQVPCCSSKEPQILEPQTCQGLEEVKENVDAVVEIMKVNVQKVIIRDEQLNQLESRANDLSQRASTFELQSKELKGRDLWKDIKGGLFFFIPITIFFAVLICK